MTENNAKIVYGHGPDELGKYQDGFENHMSPKNVKKLEKRTTEYIADVNELLGENKKATSKVTLDFIIKSTDPNLK